jgi:hypothetical protein
MRTRNGLVVLRYAGLVAMMLVVAVSFAAPAKEKKAGKGRKAKAESAAQAEEGWVSLFDGKSLDGWKVNESPNSFMVENGTIMTMNGTRSHLFYDGPVQNHDFKNFEFRADCMTTTGANSGLFIHTRFQETGWPSIGYECQVNSSHSDPKRTGSLYNTVDKVEPKGSTLSQDGKWFRYDIIVKGKQITLKVDGKTIVDYTEPADVKGGKRLSSGTFALQAHPPARKDQAGTVYFKNIMVRPLPD